MAGVPVVAHRMAKFDPERAVRLMRDIGVRNAFLPPTALKLMRQAGRQRGAGPAQRRLGGRDARGASCWTGGGGCSG